MHTEATRSVCGLARLSHENESSAFAVYTNLDLRRSKLSGPSRVDQQYYYDTLQQSKLELIPPLSLYAFPKHITIV